MFKILKKIIKSEFFKELTTMLFIVWVVLSIIFGTLASIGDMGDKSGCQYHSLAARINIPYVISCELWRYRW